jgi:hypothetical protein
MRQVYAAKQASHMNFYFARLHFGKSWQDQATRMAPERTGSAPVRQATLIRCSIYASICYMPLRLAACPE